MRWAMDRTLAETEADKRIGICCFRPELFDQHRIADSAGDQ